MSPRESLAGAVREVNLAYEQCPDPKPDVFSPLLAVEAELDAAFREGDEQGAFEVVQAWRYEALRLLSSRLINAPPEASR